MNMNKKYFISTAAIFVAYMALGMLVHGLILGSDYRQMGSLFRSEADWSSHFPFMILGHILFSGAFVWLYRKGREKKPYLQQGVRFGIAMAVFYEMSVCLIQYAVQPLPAMYIAKRIILDSIAMVCLGMLVSWLERSNK